MTRLEYDESWAEGALGDSRGSTLISESSPPYASWKRLAETARPAPQGSCLARKRTSLF